ncbi:hypothetical protein [Stenotrophomonas sp. PS02298]|uniref:hypothetical protein n=1 Tax=Stenotrophomonas sp. PS02298 TaxID=2991424 RepID=UPI00249B474E|nr:hypothetical protein [Stenotrophomonas sp. PS02298]
MQLRVGCVETNSALLPMFFYFVFFLKHACMATTGAHGGLWRRAAGRGRLKASEKYFAKMVDSKKNRD